MTFTPPLRRLVVWQFIQAAFGYGWIFLLAWLLLSQIDAAIVRMFIAIFLILILLNLAWSRASAFYAITISPETLASSRGWRGFQYFPLKEIEIARSRATETRAWLHLVVRGYSIYAGDRKTITVNPFLFGKGAFHRMLDEIELRQHSAGPPSKSPQ